MPRFRGQVRRRHRIICHLPLKTHTINGHAPSCLGASSLSCFGELCAYVLANIPSRHLHHRFAWHAVKIAPYSVILPEGAASRRPCFRHKANPSDGINGRDVPQAGGDINLLIIIRNLLLTSRSRDALVVCIMLIMYKSCGMIEIIPAGRLRSERRTGVAS